MSEGSGGPGWWQASDGRWYPPESYPAGWPPPQGTPDPGAPESPGSAGSPESGAGGPAPTGTGPGGPTPPGAYGPGQYPSGQYQPGASSPYFQSPPPVFTPAAKTNGLAIAALVCSILWGFGVLSVVAIVLGLVARSQINRTREGGSGLALAGIIVGGVGIVGAIASIIALVAVGTYIDEEFNNEARVQLIAEPDVCWETEISNLDTDLERSFEGCGPADLDLGKGLGRSALVTKVDGVGPLRADLYVDGEGRDSKTVIEDFETIKLSP